MKFFLTIMVLCSIILIGCGKNVKVGTAPWSEKQVERMEQEKMDKVPLTIVRF